MVTTQITVIVSEKPPRGANHMIGNKKKDIVRIHAAATYFAFVSRSLQQIAKVFGLPERTIRHWRDDEPEWEKTLQTIGYTGTRLFKKKPTRDPVDFQRVKSVPKSKLTTIVRENAFGQIRRVRDWARRYGWNENTRPLLRKIEKAIFIFKQILGVF